MKNVIVLKPEGFNRIPAARVLGQADLAARCNVTRHTMRRAQNGEPVSAAFVAGACLAFGVEFDVLFEVERVEESAAA